MRIFHSVIVQVKLKGSCMDVLPISLLYTHTLAKIGLKVQRREMISVKKFLSGPGIFIHVFLRLEISPSYGTSSPNLF